MKRRAFLSRLFAAPLAPAVVAKVLEHWPSAAADLAQVAPVTVHSEWGLAFEVTEKALADVDGAFLAHSQYLAYAARSIMERSAVETTYADQ